MHLFNFFSFKSGQPAKTLTSDLKLEKLKAESSRKDYLFALNELHEIFYLSPNAQFLQEEQRFLKQINNCYKNYKNDEVGLSKTAALTLLFRNIKKSYSNIPPTDNNNSAISKFSLKKVIAEWKKEQIHFNSGRTLTCEEVMLEHRHKRGIFFVNRLFKLPTETWATINKFCHATPPQQKPLPFLLRKSF